MEHETQERHPIKNPAVAAAVPSLFVLLPSVTTLAAFPYGEGGPRSGGKGPLYVVTICTSKRGAGARTKRFSSVRAPALCYGLRIVAPYKGPAPGAALRSAPVLSRRERLWARESSLFSVTALAGFFRFMAKLCDRNMIEKEGEICELLTELLTQMIRRKNEQSNEWKSLIVFICS